MDGSIAGLGTACKRVVSVEGAQLECSSRTLQREDPAAERGRQCVRQRALRRQVDRAAELGLVATQQRAVAQRDGAAVHAQRTTAGAGFIVLAHGGSDADDAAGDEHRRACGRAVVAQDAANHRQAACGHLHRALLIALKDGLLGVGRAAAGHLQRARRGGRRRLREGAVHEEEL